MRPSLLSVFGRFLRFGCLAWGGPVAQIGMLKRELVEREGWIDAGRFNRLLAVYQLLPGPEAHELCVHLGMVRRGRWGGVAAGLGFLLPGLLLTLILAHFYAQIDMTRPWLAAAFAGVQFGVVALVMRAVQRIGAHALGTPLLGGIAVAAAAATALGAPFWLVLPVAAVAATARGPWAWGLLAVLVAAGALGPEAVARTEAPGAGGAVSALLLFGIGLKAGLLTFGGAYTAIPFVRGDTVGRGWVSDRQFLDSLALTGAIPAPLIIFATFVGHVAGGLPGALAITAGIFLPAFAFALLYFDRLEALVDHPRLQAALEGVAAGVVGMIAVTAVQLAVGVARGVPQLWVGAAIFVAALVVLVRWKSSLAVPAVIAGSALAGLAAWGG